MIYVQRRLVLKGAAKDSVAGGVHSAFTLHLSRPVQRFCA